MTPFSRDISATLIFKMVLLVALWFFFVRGLGKPVKNVQQWMLGSHISDTGSVKKPVKER